MKTVPTKKICFKAPSFKNNLKKWNCTEAGSQGEEEEREAAAKEIEFFLFFLSKVFEK